MLRPILAASLVFGVHAYAATSVTADVPQCSDSDARRLAGHNFLYPLLQETAFATSHAGTSFSTGSQNVPELPIGQLGKTNVTVQSLSDTLGFGVAFAKWIGLDVSLGATALAGTTGSAILLAGASYLIGGDGDMVFRILRDDSTGTQLSFRGGGGYFYGRELTLLPFTLNLISTPGLTAQTILNGNLRPLLVVPVKQSNGHGGFYVAQSLGPIFSVQASGFIREDWNERDPFDPTIGARTTYTGHAFHGGFAGAVDADFASLHVPVAVMGEYAFSGGNESGLRQQSISLSTHEIAAGLYYTGRRDLQLGIRAARFLADTPRLGLGPTGINLRSGNPRSDLAQFMIQYVW